MLLAVSANVQRQTPSAASSCSSAPCHASCPSKAATGWSPAAHFLAFAVTAAGLAYCFQVLPAQSSAAACTPLQDNYSVSGKIAACREMFYTLILDQYWPVPIIRCWQAIGTNLNQSDGVAVN